VRTLDVAVVGASGYVGGELLRILLGHPMVTVAAATSNRFAGRRVDGRHPNLRGLTDLTFRPADRLGACDVLFAATPPGASSAIMKELTDRTGCVIDLSPDFRLGDLDTYARYYDVPHQAGGILGTFVRGLPETHRAQLRGASRISVPGCMATAAILALAPLAEAGLVSGEVEVDARTGSSGSGAAPAAASVHAERSGALRVFAPVGHRHEAEIAQATGLRVRMTATGIPAVRGVQVLCKLRLDSTAGGGGAAADLRAVYRARYAGEPFVRVIARQHGLHRYPDPKILAGSNFCDVGYAADAESGRVTVISALDNLVKGGAGNAVQCLNVAQGWPERAGLGFPGLHPI
jgi:[amino group carrier protein]-6-phospho-L-2-aminoadipate/5-phospho-L-glutamate reductase